MTTQNNGNDQKSLTRRDFIKKVGATGVAFGVASAFPVMSAKADLKPIVYGAALPLGDPTGVEAKRASILAVEEINKAGGIKLPDGKHPVKLVISDSRDLEPGVPVSEAILTVERLILKDKADFIIAGPERSEAWLAAARLSYKYKKIMIAGPGCVSPRIEATIAKDPEGKYKYCWKIQIDARSDLKHALGLFGNLKKELGLNKFYVMIQDVAWTRAAGGAVKKLLSTKLGWECVGLQRYPTGSSDFSLGLIEAKKKGADMIYMAFEMPQVGILMKQWADLKVPALPIGPMPSAQDEAYWKVSQGACEYAIPDMFWVGNGPSKVLNPWTERWFKNFTRKWGVEPGQSCGVPCYISAWAIKDAIERAGSIDSDKVAKAFYTTDLEVPWGKLRFHPKGHDAIVTNDPKTGMVTMWMQWQSQGVEVMGRHSKRVCVWPPAASVGKIIFPPWANRA